MYASSHTSISTQLTSIAPTTFPVVSMDGKQMLCSWYFYTCLQSSLTQTFITQQILQQAFPPLFFCYNHSTCVTLWYRFNCSMGKLGNRSSCFTQLEVENTELDSLESLVLDPRPQLGFNFCFHMGIITFNRIM